MSRSCHNLAELTLFPFISEPYGWNIQMELPHLSVYREIVVWDIFTTGLRARRLLFHEHTPRPPIHSSAAVNCQVLRLGIRGSFAELSAGSSPEGFETKQSCDQITKKTKRHTITESFAAYMNFIRKRVKRGLWIEFPSFAAPAILHFLIEIAREHWPVDEARIFKSATVMSQINLIITEVCHA